MIGARYRLDRRLAAGGMGVVWSAHDELLGRPVALKVLHPNLADDDGFRQRFRAEARAAARMSHPGVVAVYDYGEDADVTFLAMELVGGESLHQLLRRRGPFPPDEAMQIVAQAAAALAEAHARGLVHRDVKPANLLVAPGGAVKVTDFGIARAVDLTTATLDGSVLGTVAYMSPEQIRGERVTAPSDVYSLGVVAYEVLAGVRPFPAQESIAVALSHLHDPVPPLPVFVPDPVAALVGSLLEKDPAARPTARQVADRARGLAVDSFAVDSFAVDSPTSLLAPKTEPVLSQTAPHTTAAAFGEALLPGKGTGAATRPAPLRRLGAALGSAALAAGGRASRRRTSLGAVLGTTLVALVLGLVLAASWSGAGSPGKASPARHHVGNRTAAVKDPDSSTTTSSSTTTPTTAPVLATTVPLVAPGPGQGPPGGPGPGGTGPGGTGPGGTGPGGTGPGGPGHKGHRPGQGGTGLGESPGPGSD